MKDSSLKGGLLRILMGRRDVNTRLLKKPIDASLVEGTPLLGKSISMPAQEFFFDF